MGKMAQKYWEIWCCRELRLFSSGKQAEMFRSTTRLVFNVVHYLGSMMPPWEIIFKHKIEK